MNIKFKMRRNIYIIINYKNVNNKNNKTLTKTLHYLIKCY